MRPGDIVAVRDGEGRVRLATVLSLGENGPSGAKRLNVRANDGAGPELRDCPHLADAERGAPAWSWSTAELLEAGPKTYRRPRAPKRSTPMQDPPPAAGGDYPTPEGTDDGV